MPSQAQTELTVRLKDVKEIIEAHVAITGAGRGRPAQKQGAAITRAGIVLLSAATEAYVEDLYEEAARLIFVGMSDDDLKRLFRNTSKRLNNADVQKTELLFFNLGIPWVLQGISWRNFTNATLRSDLDHLIVARNQIAHGRGQQINLWKLRRWKNMVEMLAPKLDDKVALHIRTVTGQRPNW